MAKNIRWQIPFVSIGGTHYRIDIYDEGTFTPVTITGGTNPFTTSEDDSDDYFAPIRTQSGTIEVCTIMPDGNYITLDDLLPANNIARPVRLINRDNSDAIEWQGFLSCEAYDQDYTSIPQILQLPVISVLEAMASVEVDQTKLSGLNTVGSTINQLLEIFIVEAGVSYFTEYYVPTIARGRNIVSKYIDATVLFEQKEYNNENSTTYIVSGLSLKDCLSQIATYMGWIVREQGIALYFMDADEMSGYNRRYRQGQITPGGQVIHRWMPDMSDTSIVVGYMASMKWRGTDHKRTVSQGAKSVEVVAKLAKYKLDIELPECPVGSLVEQYRQLWNNQTTYGDWLYLLANSNENAYSHMGVAYFSALGGLIGNNWAYQNYAQSTLTEVLDHIAVGSNSSVVYMWHLLHNSATWCAGAFLCKYDWENTGTATAHDTDNALYCSFFPLSIAASSDVLVLDSDFDPSQIGQIFEINSIVNFRAANGYIRLSANADTVYWYDSGFDGPAVTHSNNINDEWGIAFELSVGNKWWNGSGWQDTQCYFFARMTKNGFKSNWEETMPITKTDGLLIPVSTTVQGIVTLKIWPMASNLASDSGTQFAHSSIMEMIFSQLSVDYIPPMGNTLTDRSENHYFQLLGTNFRDEISVNTDLASTLNNQPSPSLIMNSETEAMTELNYGTTQSPDMRRPEVDLLNRLAAYYQAARQRLSLIVAHPTAAPLPLLRLNGLSPDTRKYLPLAESRDWINDTSTLTCMETPT